MAVMYDSTDANGIPADATIVAGYVDGLYPSYPAMVQRFPNAQHVSIAVTAKDHNGDWVHARVLDVEQGDAVPADAPGWAKAMRALGVSPTIYCSRASVWPAVQIAFRDAFVAPPDYWIADYTNYPHLVQGSVATQWHDFGLYDQSQTNGIWPGTTPVPTQGGNVLVALTSTGGGYWLVKADGSVYAYGDAKYENGVNNSGPGGKTALVPGDHVTGIAGHGTDGYLISTAMGNLYAFGSAPFLGHP